MDRVTTVPVLSSHKAAMAVRAFEAQTLRTAGYTFPEIAERVGFANAGGAYKSVRWAEDRWGDRDRNLCLVWEWLRLEALFGATWRLLDSPFGGLQVRAAGVGLAVLEVMDRLCDDGRVRFEAPTVVPERRMSRAEMGKALWNQAITGTPTRGFTYDRWSGGMIVDDVPADVYGWVTDPAEGVRVAEQVRARTLARAGLWDTATGERPDPTAIRAALKLSTEICSWQRLYVARRLRSPHVTKPEPARRRRARWGVG